MNEHCSYSSKLRNMFSIAFHLLSQVLSTLRVFCDNQGDLLEYLSILNRHLKEIKEHEVKLVDLSRLE